MGGEGVGRQMDALLARAGTAPVSVVIEALARTKDADTYQLGLAAHELLTGVDLSLSEDPQADVIAMLSAENLPAGLLGLLVDMTAADPSERPGIEEVRHRAFEVRGEAPGPDLVSFTASLAPARERSAGPIAAAGVPVWWFVAGAGWLAAMLALVGYALSLR